MIWSVIWFWLLGVFTAADIITTKIILFYGGVELNPLMAPIADTYWFVVIKLLAIAAVTCYAVILEKAHRGHGWAPLAAGTTVTFFAVVWNIVQLAMVV